MTNVHIGFTVRVMHLSTYMQQKKLLDRHVAEATGVSRVTISRIRRKLVRPEWETILALKKFSNNEIRANDFETLGK